MRPESKIPQKASRYSPLNERLRSALITPGIVVIGPLPPPVHGYSQATADVVNFLRTRGQEVMAVDTKPARKSGGVLSALKLRSAQFVSVWKGARHGAAVYVALSGGARQAVDLLFLAAARMNGAKIFIHHHSFAYLDRWNPLAYLCCTLAGKQAVHLALCERMKALLRGRYRSCRVVEVISNAGLPSVRQQRVMRRRLQTIGYFSAITREKGILDFLRVARDLAAQTTELAFLIAGPCEDRSLLDAISQACREHANIRYLGPVYGEEKQEFLRSLDILLFPTQYKNEAEPLAIWEAISSGIPVIARDRGCIGEMLASDCGAGEAVKADADFVTQASVRILDWAAAPEEYRRIAEQQVYRFEAMAARSGEVLERLFCSTSVTSELSAHG